MEEHNIREKSPKDNISSKTPKEETVTKIKHKTPENEEFVLPPPKSPDNKSIRKSQVNPPTNYGSQKKQMKKTKSKNVPPPRPSLREYRKVTKKPGSRGFIPNRRKLHGKVLPNHIGEDRSKPPSNKGVSSNKKRLRSVNTPLQKEIKDKIPIKKRSNPPPTFEKKKRFRIVNKTPSLEISYKTPENKKSKPPTIQEKIPKTKINSKKPK
jgi:hypothetical protein